VERNDVAQFYRRAVNQVQIRRVVPRIAPPRADR